MRSVVDAAIPGNLCSKRFGGTGTDASWGIAFDPGTNLVNVCIARLRSKLGAYAIQTVRNVGYAVPV